MQLHVHYRLRSTGRVAELIIAVVYQMPKDSLGCRRTAMAHGRRIGQHMINLIRLGLVKHVWKVEVAGRWGKQG